jgi:hypothetical protein
MAAHSASGIITTSVQIEITRLIGRGNSAVCRT